MRLNAFTGERRFQTQKHRTALFYTDLIISHSFTSLHVDTSEQTAGFYAWVIASHTSFLSLCTPGRQAFMLALGILAATSAET